MTQLTNKAADTLAAISHFLLFQVLVLLTFQSQYHYQSQYQYQCSAFSFQRVTVPYRPSRPSRPSCTHVACKYSQTTAQNFIPHDKSDASVCSPVAPETPLGTGFKLTIRPAELHELVTVAKLRCSVFYPQYLTLVNFITDIQLKIRTRVVGDNSVCIIARQEDEAANNTEPALPLHFRQFGKFIGTLEISENDFRGTSLETVGYHRKLYLADLAIRIDMRRRGIASRMLEHVEAYMRTEDFREVYLHVEKTNAVARQLYAKHGYIEVPPTAITDAFTLARLQKPAEDYVLLWKEVKS